MRVAAIGPKTAEALAAHGIRADLMPTAYVGEAVADALLARTIAGERILLYRAGDAREALPRALRAAGRVVDDVAAYATSFVDDPELRDKTARADIVTFTSASTVGGFVHNVPDAAQALAGKRSPASARSPRRPPATPASGSTSSPTSSPSTACCSALETTATV